LRAREWRRKRSRAYRALILAGRTSDQISGLPSEVYYLIILPPAFGINDLAEFCEKIYGLQSLTSQNI
jgi:hypothetical protein